MSRDNNNLYELLRERRNEVAKEAGIEPFMVLHNSVLVEIAEKKPTTAEKLVEIKGMGKKKLLKSVSLSISPLPKGDRFAY